MASWDDDDDDDIDNEEKRGCTDDDDDAEWNVPNSFRREVGRTKESQSI